MKKRNPYTTKREKRTQAPANVMAIELRLSGKYAKRIVKSKVVYNRAKQKRDNKVV